MKSPWMRYIRPSIHAEVLPRHLGVGLAMSGYPPEEDIGMVGIWELTP
jgi:hypothetical protein